MPTLIISRPSEWNSRFRNYEIFLNGDKLGDVANGKAKEFEVPVGTHTVTATIDWCGSQEHQIAVTANEAREIKVSGFAPGKWLVPFNLAMLLVYFILNLAFNVEVMFLLLLVLPMFLYQAYFMTFGRNKFLRLAVVQ
ncbi:hypothetical protein MKJ04_02870 [Pontibacter sp. E15-1]|uniref:hypothetical protein n=1 Tax=Pontibacter sp. E15-1 TaxID=2919918 RepID=UPI001F4F8DD6|nr:hypothetical protein [Pontibacter sp. E15-1]MCJ8163767.1 hypothetical protein [Pontibacter sp. E15-1]